MTVEKQALYDSIMTTLQALEERAVINNDKINDVRLLLGEYKALTDNKFGLYEGIAKGLSIAIKILGGVTAVLVTTVVSLAIYILKTKGVL